MTLEEICTHIVDCAHKTAPITESGSYFAVGTPAMRGHFINYKEARPIDQATFAAWTTRLRPKHGDLLLAREAPVGPVVRIPPEENVAPGQRTVLLRPNPSVVDSRFLYYYLISPARQSELLVKASGSTVPHLNVADVRTLPTPGIPSLVKQRAIAGVLEVLDDKTAANDHLAATALELARTMYNKILRGKPGIPMSRVLTPILGGTPTRSDESLWNGAVAWASAKDVASAKRGVILSTLESITEQAASKTRTRMLPIGTVVLTARGTVGAVARLGIPAAINQSCYGFVPSTIPASCLFFAVEDAASQARSMAHGSVFDTITMSTFEHVQIPRLDNQEWASVEERIAPILAVSQQAVSESRKLAATRDELLPLLMSGKIRVREAEEILEGVV